MRLCLLSSFGRKVAVPAPVCDALIGIVSALHRTDYRSRGRTLADLGTESLSLAQLRELLVEGRWPE